MALQFPETTEGTHFEMPDLRVNGKIFASLELERDGYGVVVLTQEQQAEMVEESPEIFSPVPGPWGRKGWTRVKLRKVQKEVLYAALRAAWIGKAPKRFLGKL